MKPFNEIGILLHYFYNMTSYFHGSVHRNNILIYIQDAALHSLFYLETALHVSGGTILLDIY